MTSRKLLNIIRPKTHFTFGGTRSIARHKNIRFLAYYHLTFLSLLLRSDHGVVGENWRTLARTVLEEAASKKDRAEELALRRWSQKVAATTVRTGGRRSEQCDAGVNSARRSGVEEEEEDRASEGSLFRL
uniref:Uncharacterized protein n=1 Tax=Opuntia streptacantha TaxID=393608 RepID=A0A7C9EMA3_OPUST